VIATSTGALLGTTEAPDPAIEPATSPPGSSALATFPFARNDIDGGSVELTEAAPTATFYVIITATDLAPNGVQSTNNALARLHGLVTTSELSKGAAPPLVSIRASSPDATG